MSFSGRLITLLPTLLLVACAVTEPAPQTHFAAPATFKETGLWRIASNGRETANGFSSATVPDAWWQLFNDPVLDNLERQLIAGNENMKAALARVAGARAALESVRSRLSPTVSAGLGGARSKNVAPLPGLSNSASLTANASWELDLWQRISLAERGAEADVQADLHDLAAVRLSAQATLVQAYLAMRAAEVQRAIIERSVAAYQRFFDLTNTRYQAGVAAQADMLAAQAQLKAEQAQLNEVTVQRAQLEHAIAVLLGKSPQALVIEPAARLPSPPAVPVLLPSVLLERRPDIAAAERRVASAYAQIGVANAAFFPVLTLSAGGGYKGTSLGTLIGPSNLFWSVGPTLAQTLFDGGARRAASNQAQADADLAMSNYRQTVLTAFQEVEDNLIAADQASAEVKLQEEALHSAQRVLEIALDQYHAGTFSYLNVVIAQTTAFGNERSLVDLRLRQLNAVNQLLKNIAGRW
jgi:NodT family efflux transporter outer membrane factor (OMF) lipoprotein